MKIIDKSKDQPNFDEDIYQVGNVIAYDEAVYLITTFDGDVIVVSLSNPLLNIEYFDTMEDLIQNWASNDDRLVKAELTIE